MSDLILGLSPLQRYYLPYYLRSDMTLRPSAKFQLLYITDGKQSLTRSSGMTWTQGKLRSRPESRCLSGQSPVSGVRSLREPERLYPCKTVHGFLEQYVLCRYKAGLWNLFGMQAAFGLLAFLFQLPFTLPKDIKTARKRTAQNGRQT